MGHAHTTGTLLQVKDKKRIEKKAKKNLLIAEVNTSDDCADLLEKMKG